MQRTALPFLSGFRLAADGAGVPVTAGMESRGWRRPAHVTIFQVGHLPPLGLGAIGADDPGATVDSRGSVILSSWRALSLTPKC